MYVRKHNSKFLIKEKIIIVEEYNIQVGYQAIKELTATISDKGTLKRGLSFPEKLRTDNFTANYSRSNIMNVYTELLKIKITLNKIT